MTAEPGTGLSRLVSALHAADFPVENLAVDGYRPVGDAWRPRPAAVLVPIVLQPEPAVVLTVRSDALHSHAGQVALPGGGRSAGEAFPLGTALREASEEIGITPGEVRVVGMTRCFDTISAYRIVPVVGLIDIAPQLTACPNEVRAIFLVPLRRVLDPSSYCRHDVRHRARHYELWSMRSECWPVWGATAAILAHLAELAN